MTVQEENNYIHHLLPDLLREPICFDLMDYEYPANPDTVETIADRLETAGLVKVPSARNPFHVNLTTKGKEIAERSDGYLGYLEEQRQLTIQQQQAQAEKDKLELAANRATVSAARAAWVAAGFSLLSIAISIFALYQTNQLGEAQRQITALEQQVKRLSASH